MRLTEVRAKKSINSDELHVREEAVSYFARSFSQDKAVLPLAIGAIEKYGDEEAFQAYTFLEQLAHSPETLGWVSDRLQTIQQPPADEDLYGSLSNGLIRSFIHADPALLQPYQDQIDQLGCLDEQARLTVTERLRLASVAPDELWDDLEQFCERHKSDNDLPQADLNHVDRVVEALGRHNDLFADRVLDLLSLAIQDFENNPLVWLELFAVRLAGEMRLEAAVPLLIEKLHADGDWLIEESLWALIKIGTDSVVTGLGEEYIATDWQFRFSAAGILQDIHSDQAVTTCFQLLAIEDDPELRDHLYRALLLNGATEAFEPVRELLLETDGDRDPDWLELRSELVTAATIMDVELPELAEWKEDMQHDMEFRRQWYAEQHGRLETPADDDFGSAGFAGEDFDVDEEWTRPTDTLVTSKKVGRNEPCPCGSGKKYKKCCLRKEKGSVLS